MEIDGCELDRGVSPAAAIPVKVERIAACIVKDIIVGISQYSGVGSPEIRAGKCSGIA